MHEVGEIRLLLCESILGQIFNLVLETHQYKPYVPRFHNVMCDEERV